MITTAVLAALVFTAPGDIDRRAAESRIALVEDAWLACDVPLRRRAAVAALEEAGRLMSPTAGEPLKACQRLDEALALLENRAKRNEDAVIAEFSSSRVAPGAMAELYLGWAYPPAKGESVTVRAASRSVQLAPGTDRTLSISSDTLLPSLRNGQEGIAFAPIQVGEQKRMVRLEVRAEGKQFTFLEYFPDVKAGRTQLRAMVPAKPSSPKTVVIAFPDQLGYPSTFFDHHGKGIAVRESRSRGWAFVECHGSADAVPDSLRWLGTAHGWTEARVVILGHGLGSYLALDANQTLPNAMVLLGSYRGTLPPRFANVPTFLAAGRLSADDVIQATEGLEGQLKGQAGSETFWSDNCGSVMIGAEALPEAFRFLDRTFRSPSPFLNLN